MKYKMYGLWSLVLVLACAGLVHADDPTSKFVPLSPIPSTLPPSSTGLAVQCELWDQASGGTLIHPEPKMVDTDDSSFITNDTGFADLLLGRPRGLNPADFPAGSSRYLDITQDGSSVLAARIPLYASVFGLTADTAATVNPGAIISGSVVGAALKVINNRTDRTAPGGASSEEGGEIAAPSGSIGIQGDTNSPTGAGVYGHATSSNGPASGVYGEADSPDGSGVFGLSNGGFGVFGKSTNNWGVRGDSTNNNGVQGLASAAGKAGVAGRNDNANGFGVFGFSTNGWGVRGDSTNNNGVQGLASAPGTSGVAGRNDNADGSGTSGFSTNGWGVRGDSTNNNGVQGFASAAGKAGVAGRNDNANGFGVLGFSQNGDGVFGVSNAAGKSGVFGGNSNANGFAGFFNGKVQVNGVLQITGGSDFSEQKEGGKSEF